MRGTQENIDDGKRSQPVNAGSRVRWLKFIFLLAFAVITGRLVQVQAIESSKYQKIARTQYEVRLPLLASRGTIYDRNGKILVSSTMAVSYAADPKMVGKDAGAIAERFEQVFGKKKETYLAKLRRKDSRFVWLERRASLLTVNRIKADEFDGLIQTNEPKRLYHYDHVAGQLLGFTDIDNNGLSGAELEFDRELKGTDGYIVMQRDGLGRKRPTVDYPRLEPVNGNNIVLTIDVDYQSIAEEELHNGIKRNGATGGLVVMLDPNTGEVLAMAGSPGINPNDLAQVDPATTRIRAITDTFEPGSVFKLVTMSAALEHHLIQPGQRFFAENGKYLVKGRPAPISDVHKHGMLSFREAVEVSSNIVMAKASDIIGAEKLYTTARNYGFGIPTGLELPGEVGGQLKKPREWSRTTLNTMSFGYEVGVTPLQIAAAYASVANDGVLMKPYLLKQILDPRKDVLLETQPQVIRKVVSKPTADTMRAFLRGVVERGSATVAKSGTVAIAGKTGTSRKIIDGKYSTSNHTASFVGMFPADDPRIVCLVMLDNPRAYGYYGGVASAPIVKGIAEKIAATSGSFTRQHLPDNADVVTIAVPDVRGLGVGAAVAIVEARGFKTATDGEGSIVSGQSPAPGAIIPAGERVRLVARTEDVAGGYTTVPDLRGLALRRALNRLTTARLDAVVEGSGVVEAQTPRPGEKVKVGTRVGIRCAADQVMLSAR